MALAYILGKTSSRILKTNLNIPVIFALSILPDVDLLIPFLSHRGPTHSTIVALVCFIPFFFIYRRKAIPPFLALFSHSAIADFIAGSQTQLLWPLSTEKYGIGISILSQTNITLELALFLLCILIMLKTKDVIAFFKSDHWNLLLAIPAFTVLLPTFLTYPLQVPLMLVAPHIIFLILFAASILIELAGLIRKRL